MTAAMIYAAHEILSASAWPVEHERIVRFTELGSEGTVLEVAEHGGTLGIREPRERWRIARDGFYWKMERL